MVKKQVQIYNKRAAKRQLNSVRSDKNLDLDFVKEIEKRERQLKQIDIEVEQLRKEK